MLAEGLSVPCYQVKLETIASQYLCHIAILQLRIYALYSLNKRLLAWMVIFYLACSACSAWIVLAELTSISSMDSYDVFTFQFWFFFPPLPLQVSAPILPTISAVDGSSCLPQFLPRAIYRFWIPMLSYESLLCVLVLIQGFRRFKSDSSIFRSGKRLVSILIRDSIIYFLVCVFHLSFFLFSPSVRVIPLSFFFFLS